MSTLCSRAICSFASSWRSLSPLHLSQHHFRCQPFDPSHFHSYSETSVRFLSQPLHNTASTPGPGFCPMPPLLETQPKPLYKEAYSPVALVHAHCCHSLVQSAEKSLQPRYSRALSSLPGGYPLCLIFQKHVCSQQQLLNDVSNPFFRYVTPCGSWRFGETYRLHQGDKNRRARNNVSSN
jgi:hypothetical protein